MIKSKISNKIFVVLFLSIFLISFSSAMNIDNTKRFENDENSYGKYTIKNGFGFGKKIMDIELIENSETCGEECFAIKEISLNKETSLIDSVEFFTLQENGDWNEQSIRSYQFYINTSGQQILVNDYGQVQNGTSPNGTIIYGTQITGTHYENAPEWTPYTLETIMPKGDYTVKLEGHKKPSRTVDWIVKTNGKVLDEWAIWGNISLGDDAEVILNSPTDGFSSLTQEIEFNATANVTGGATLTNMSLWTNESGSWEEYNISNLIRVEAHNQSNNLSIHLLQSNLNAKAGANIITSNPANKINGFIKNSSTTATHCYLMKEISTNILLSGTFTGTYCKFNQSLLLDNAASYWLMVDSNGAAFSSYRSEQIIGTLPLIDDGFSWNSSWDGGNQRTDIQMNVQTITFDSVGELKSPTQTFNRTITESIIWNVQACDSDGDCGFSSANYSLFLDTEAPTIDIISPVGTYGFLKNGSTLQLAGFVNDTNLDSVWYNYNGTNVTLSATTETLFNETFNQEGKDNLNLTIWANDSIGNLGFETSTWDYNVFETGIDYDLEVIESESNTFTYLFSSMYNLENAFFVYNGTSYASNIISLGGEDYSLDSTIQAPIVETLENLTFYFVIDTDFNGEVNSSFYNQSVNSLSFDNCSVFTTSILEMNLFDERTLASINGTFEVNFNVLNPIGNSKISSFTGTAEDKHTATVCSNINLSDKEFLYDLELRYFKSDGGNFIYAPEFYHIQKASTSTLPQNISLYDLSSNESTEFTINYRDNNYIAGQNHLIQVLRTYVGEDISRVVEIPITSTEGSAVAHFDLNNYKYNFIVTKDGEIVNVFNNPAVRCESEISGLCSIDLKGEKATPFAQSVSEINDFEYIPSVIEDEIKITFSSPSGTNKNVRALMVQSSPFSDDQVICNSSVLSASGSISCFPNETIGDSSISIKLFVDGETEANLQTTFQEDLTPAFQGDNYFIGALLLLILIGMAVSSPQLMIWIGVFGLVLLGFLFLLQSKSVGLISGAIIWFVLAAIIATIKINNRSEA